MKSITDHRINNSGSVYFGPSTREMIWHRPWKHGALVVKSSSNMERTVTYLSTGSPGESGARHATRPHRTRRRTRAFWVVAILIAAACTPFNDGVLIALKGCGDLGSGKCSAAATAALALARLAKMCLQVIGAFGACAMMPTRLTPLTHAGRDSIVILLLNGSLLALFKVPLTLATLFARERFGGLTMQARWVGVCTLLALGAHNVASAVLRPVGIIVADATVHVRSGRRTKAVIRVLPLACMLIAVWLFIRTTNAPVPPRAHRD